MYKPKSMEENGWRKSEEYKQPKNAALVAKMVEEIKALNLPKLPPTKEQAPSTQALLEAQAKRPESEDSTYWEEKWSKPFVPEAMAVKDPKNIDELVQKKTFDAQEIAIVEDIRGKARNTLGQSLESSVTEESKERASQAFNYSKPADLNKEDKERIVKLLGIESTPVPEELLESAKVAAKGKDESGYKRWVKDFLEFVRS